MPIYEAVCVKCGKYHEYIKKSADYLDTPICCGIKSEKRILTSPMMTFDVQPWEAFESPATGKLITSKAERREDMKASGCREWEGMKAEKQNAERQKKYEDDALDAKLDKDVRQAWAALPDDKKATVLAA